MGLPVITTDFGGSTEFVTEESGLLIKIHGLTATTGDDWLKGGNWARIDIDSLQETMRKVYQNRIFAKQLGQRGKKYMEKFSPDAVAKSYVHRLATIYTDILPTLTESRGKSKTKTPASMPIKKRHTHHNIAGSLTQSHDLMSHGEKVAANLDIQFGQTGRFKTCSVRSYKRNRPRKYPASLVGGMAASSASVANESALSAVSPPTSTSSPRICDYVIISTWSPRLCGIATFSSALRNSLLAACPPGSRVDVVAVKHKDQSTLEFNQSEVKKTFVESEPMSYVSAAQFINNQGYHTALVQYEFGMLYGDHLTCMFRELKTPKVFTTIHTVKINYQPTSLGTAIEFHVKSLGGDDTFHATYLEFILGTWCE